MNKWQKIKNSIYNNKLEEISELFSEVSNNFSNLKTSQKEWISPLESWANKQLSNGDAFKLSLQEYKTLKNTINNLNENFTVRRGKEKEVISEFKSRFTENYYRILEARELDLKLDTAANLIQQKKFPVNVFFEWYIDKHDLPTQQFKEELDNFWGDVWKHAGTGALAGGTVGSAGGIGGTFAGAGLGGVVGGAYGAGKNLLKTVWNWHKNKTDFNQTKIKALEALKKLKTLSVNFNLEPNFLQALDAFIEQLGTAKAYQTKQEIPTVAPKTVVKPEPIVQPKEEPKGEEPPKDNREEAEQKERAAQQEKLDKERQEAEIEAKRLADEEAKRLADEEAKRKAEAKERIAELRRKKLEEKKKKEAEIEAKRLADEEAKQKKEPTTSSEDIKKEQLLQKIDSIATHNDIYKIYDEAKANNDKDILLKIGAAFFDSDATTAEEMAKLKINDFKKALKREINSPSYVPNEEDEKNLIGIADEFGKFKALTNAGKPEDMQTAEKEKPKKESAEEILEEFIRIQKNNDQLFEKKQREKFIRELFHMSKERFVGYAHKATGKTEYELKSIAGKEGSMNRINFINKHWSAFKGM